MIFTTISGPWKSDLGTVETNEQKGNKMTDENKVGRKQFTTRKEFIRFVDGFSGTPPKGTYIARKQKSGSRTTHNENTIMDQYSRNPDMIVLEYRQETYVDVDAIISCEQCGLALRDNRCIECGTAHNCKKENETPNGLQVVKHCERCAEMTETCIKSVSEMQKEIDKLRNVISDALSDKPDLDVSEESVKLRTLFIESISKNYSAANHLILQLCYAIEALPAGERQTSLSAKASELRKEIDAFINPSVDPNQKVLPMDTDPHYEKERMEAIAQATAEHQLESNQE